MLCSELCKSVIPSKFHQLVVEMGGGGGGRGGEGRGDREPRGSFNAIILNHSIEHNFRHNAMFSAVTLKSIICSQIFELNISDTCYDSLLLIPVF